MGYTFKDIGSVFGTSHQRIQQIYKKHYGTGQEYNLDWETWDEALKSKQKSLYYTLLVKHYGKEMAERIWKDREDPQDFNIWSKVKNYKPRDPTLIKEFNKLV